MSEIGQEFNRNLTDGIKWGSKFGGLVGGTFISLLTALIFGVYNGYVNIKDNEKGGKDIDAGIDGKNENLALKQIANEYLGEIDYSELKDKAFELNSSLENFDKSVWEKYCKQYGLTYSAISEVGVDGKEKIKINVHEDKARDLEKVFIAYNNEMQSKERTKIINTQLKLVEDKAKEENLDVSSILEKYNNDSNFKNIIDENLVYFNELENSGEIKFKAVAFFMSDVGKRIGEFDENHPKYDILSKNIINEIKENTISNNFFDKKESEKKVELSNEEILDDPNVSKKVNNQKFNDMDKEIKERPDYKEQNVEKHKSHGEKSR
ncbi:hypothetical protein [Parvimonas parva]|uniref:Uncharacterized protein n=1 Tax=Parvimonas parva TaxID=2769485 RepID=A0ABS1C8L6_9FIRM|nr:hypothetical protein [Parvimonas parva]MBK1468448.1 hypothetical protein [Parvimonas parva]